MGSRTEVVCMGDYVALYNDDNNGYMFSHFSSCRFNSLYVYHNQTKDNPVGIQSQQAISFEVCARNRYKLGKDYNKLLKTTNKQNEGDLARLKKAQNAALSEDKDNEAEQKRQRGKSLRYGNVIQLRHCFTGKYMHMSTDQTSARVKNHLTVYLAAENQKHAQFKILPRFKVKSEGDIVRVGDQIILESVKSQGQYIDLSQSPYPITNISGHEVNLGVSKAGFSIIKVTRPAKDQFVTGGSVVRFFHKELEAYLVAEGCFRQITEQVHLHIRKIDLAKPHTNYPSTSSNTYWEIEAEQGITYGDKLRWQQQVRLRHMTTRLYLSVQSDGQVVLLENPYDPATVFRLHPVIFEQDYVEIESYARLEHNLTGFWLHGLSGEDYIRSEGGDPSLLDILVWDKAPLCQVKAQSGQKYDDAFTIQYVRPGDLSNFNFVVGVIPMVVEMLVNVKDGIMNENNTSQYFALYEALDELKKFMLKDGKPCIERQKLMRNLKMVDLFVSYLQHVASLPHNPHIVWIKKVAIKMYEVLENYLLGDSRKNELYFAKYITFFQTQFTLEDEVGLKAVAMITELIKDNRQIVDRVSKDSIDSYVRLVKERKNHLYLKLLSVLCVCDGIAIPDNQTHIVHRWLCEGQGGVYLTELGERIDKEEGQVYVSTDDGRSWLPLHTFVSKRSTAAAESSSGKYNFLEEQLNLFSNLCYGRNAFAIETITHTKNYLTWQEAYACLKDSHLPDELRAHYCSLIIDLIIDVGSNYPILEYPNLSFDYEVLGSKKGIIQTRIEKTVASDTEWFPVLHKWITRFLQANEGMVASEVGHNKLIAEVLRLINFLVKFGYYGDSKYINQLVKPLMSLLDGSNDKNYRKPNTHEEKELEDYYGKKGRYEANTETDAVVDAKYSAMEVLELLLTFQFNNRLEAFVTLFKTNENKRMSVLSELSVLPVKDTGKLAHGVKKRANSEMEKLINSTSYIDMEEIVPILMDLSNYKYDKMVTESMMLLNKLYSTKTDTFQFAVQSQVLLLPESLQVYEYIWQNIPTLRRLAKAKLVDEKASAANDILDNFTQFCHLPNEPEERHPMNQTILINSGILDALFILITQQRDEKTMQVPSVRGVITRCLGLVRCLARGNKVPQNFIFRHLNQLLLVHSVESDLALAIEQAFTKNQDNCMNIKAKQIRKIVQLAARHQEDAPEFLDLLCAVLKEEGKNLPIKKNQAFVMKYLMEYFKDIFYILEKPVEFQERVLMNKEGKAHLSYYISLIDLLASCAEGENRYIESVCQTLFDRIRLLNVISNEAIDNNLKRPFLRYLLWVYVNVGGTPAYIEFDNLPDLSLQWQQSLVRETEELTAYVTSHSKEAGLALKRPPPKSSVASSRHEQAYGTLHFYFDALLPFLQKFYRKLYVKDEHRRLGENLDNLTQAFISLAEVLQPLVCNRHQMDHLTRCVIVLLNYSTLPDETKINLTSRIGHYTVGEEVISNSRMEYKNSHYEEEALNVRLNNFAINFQKVYHGKNLVRDQLGLLSKRVYYDVDSDLELPLGSEFQEHLDCFISASTEPAVTYQRAGKLIQQLRISSTTLKSSQWKQPEQEALDVKCLQLLRALIHNEERKLPQNWQDSGLTAGKKELAGLTTVQDELNRQDVLRHILGLISRPQENVVKEVFALISMMLCNGSLSSQKSLARVFKSTREEMFFFAIRDRLKESEIATKETRQLAAQHEAAQQEAKADALTLQASLAERMLGEPTSKKKKGAVALEEINFGFNNNNINIAIRRKKDNKKATKGYTNKGFIPDEEQMELSPHKVQGHVDLVYKVLAGMCDGQFRELQDYLRYQPDNIKTINLVSECSTFIHLFYTDINDSTITLVTQMFTTLIEFASGCPQNQIQIFDHVIDYINYILRSEKYMNLDPLKTLELREVIVKLLHCLIEENTKETQTMVQEMKDQLQNQIIWRIAVENHHFTTSKNNVSAKHQRQMQEVGFMYMFLILRIDDLDKDFNIYDLITTRQEEEIYMWYMKNSGSVELLKDGEVHRVRFRIKNKKALREEVKEKVKWNIDRSSASNKLRDLVHWGKEIVDDVHHQEKLRSNPLAKFFIHWWPLWNNLSILLSLVINIIMLVTWEAPGSLGQTPISPADTELPASIHNPFPSTETWFPILVWVLGGCHNLIAVFVFISFFLSNRIKLPNIRNAVNIGKSFIGRKQTRTIKRENSLKVDLIGFLTIYYICFLGFSVAGTALYGYFFAFHLLNIINTNQLLQRVMQAVTQNGRSLLWVTVLGVIIIYIFSLAAFAMMRGSFNPDGEQTLYCGSLWQCAVTTLRYGVIGELFEFMQPHDVERNFLNFGLHTIFHLAFFILITTIGLNIIFGIIVDTFSELRDIQWQAQSDMKKMCFICSRDSYEFESLGEGFDAHTKKDHNMWNYIFFFIHLDEKHEMDYTNLELYVHSQYKSDKYEFFPLNHALVLEGSNMDVARTKLDEILHYVRKMKTKLDQEEIERQKKEERKRQMRWQEEHRAASGRRDS